MKKLIVSALAVAGLALSSYGQGVIYFDGTDNSNPSLNATSDGQVFINSVLDAGTQDINAALLMYNPSTSAYVTVVTLLLSSSTTTGTTAFGTIQPASGDITFLGGSLGNGPFDNSGNGYAETFVSAGSTGTFEVQGWLGAYSSYAAANTAGQAVGWTGSFTETMQSSIGGANTIENMPALNLLTSIPEPTTMALAGLGALSLLIVRRRS